MKKQIALLLSAAALTASLFAQSSKMILVEGGTFQMGDASQKDAPVHTVTVSSFYMSQNKVSVDEWMNEIGVYPDGYYGKRVPKLQWKDTIVGNVSWYDAIIYCNRKSVSEGLTPCYASNGDKDSITYAKSIRIEFQNVTCDWNADGYRLPTEAEWEYAAYNEKRISDFSKNYPEWCWDWYSSSYYLASKNSKNPHGADYGEPVFSSGGKYGGYIMCRSVRGGGKNEGWLPPVYHRSYLNPAEYEFLVGPLPVSFRVVRNAK